MGFQKATKRQVKLRLALFGPSGSGKTFTALRIAKGLGGKVAVIDSERDSASRYADRFDFDTDSAGDKTIDSYVKKMKEAGAAGYDVLIVDSLSHAWQELLQEVEKLARAKYRNNSWSAWSDGTPIQRRLVDAILSYPGHVIATMRSKTEWVQETADNGKSRPVRLGLAPEQGKGIEYEFDMLLEMSADHVGSVIKDRTGKFQDKTIDRPGEDFGVALRDWLSEAEPMEPTTVEAEPTEEPSMALADEPPDDPRAQLRWLAWKLNYGDDALLKWLRKKYSVDENLNITQAILSLGDGELQQAVTVFKQHVKAASKEAA